MSRLTLLAVSALLAVCLPSTAATIRVPDDQPTIQAGIVAAAEGDTVLLMDGAFTGPGNRDIDFVGKAVTVRSTGGDPTMCVIDCEGSEADPHRGFIFQNNEGPGSVIEGITITHGWADYYGGGIFCDDHATPTIVNFSFV